MLYFLSRHKGNRINICNSPILSSQSSSLVPLDILSTSDALNSTWAEVSTALGTLWINYKRALCFSAVKCLLCPSMTRYRFIITVFVTITSCNYEEVGENLSQCNTSPLLCILHVEKQNLDVHKMLKNADTNFRVDFWLTLYHIDYQHVISLDICTLLTKYKRQIQMKALHNLILKHNFIKLAQR